MTALDTDAGLRRGALRWALCFAIVAAAHGAAAMALLHASPSSDSGFLAGAAVVMIDLPEAPAAMPTPPSDLAPGPEEAPSEQTPPPKEEMKPPKQVAEVALPEPEPPKPEPTKEKAPEPTQEAAPEEPESTGAEAWTEEPSGGTKQAGSRDLTQEFLETMKADSGVDRDRLQEIIAEMNAKGDKESIERLTEMLGAAPIPQVRLPV